MDANELFTRENDGTCPHCGESVPHGEKECPTCGEYVKEAEPWAEPAGIGIGWEEDECEATKS